MTIDHKLLVKLCDKAVGTEGYDKAQWSELSRQVHLANEEMKPKRKAYDAWDESTWPTE